MSNILEYKGYTATVEYSAEDRVFFGKIALINDLVTFEAENVNDLEMEFQNSVEEYLKTCEELGKKPQKAFKGMFNVRIAPELHRKAAFRALEKKISLNKLVEESLEKEIA